MYKNNNKKHLKILFSFFISFFYVLCDKNNFPPIRKNSIFLNKKVDLYSDKDFFLSLQKTCQENNINLAICTQQKKNIQCSFNNVPLKDILSISLNNDYYIEEKNGFVKIEDIKEIIKTYKIQVLLNEKQNIHLMEFLSSLTNNIKGKYSFNKDDGILIFMGLPSTHKFVEEYINNINQLYDQQVLLECKIISISHQKNQNKNLDAFNLMQKIFNSSTFNFFSAAHMLVNNLLLTNDMDSVVRFLSSIYQIQNIHHIKILISHGKESKFTTNETRHSNKFYETTFVPHHQWDMSNNKNKGALMRNMKVFNAGINLILMPHMRQEDVVFHMSYEQSSFQDTSNKNSLPNIIKNSFSSVIKIKYGEIVIINGLKNKIYKKKQKNTTRFWWWNLLFAQEEREEIECQTIFLIKVCKK